MSPHLPYLYDYVQNHFNFFNYVVSVLGLWVVTFYGERTKRKRKVNEPLNVKSVTDNATFAAQNKRAQINSLFIKINSKSRDV